MARYMILIIHFANTLDQSQRHEILSALASLRSRLRPEWHHLGKPSSEKCTIFLWACGLVWLILHPVYCGPQMCI